MFWLCSSSLLGFFRSDPWNCSAACSALLLKTVDAFMKLRPLPWPLWLHIDRARTCAYVTNSPNHLDFLMYWTFFVTMI